ncbi:MAG: hypothetical protein RL106_706 [Bacteroidota bacterium]
MILFFAVSVSGQKTQEKRTWKSKWNEPSSPFKATILSAALPGAGQWYNNKKWKTPIVLTGVGTCAYFIVYNGNKYREYKSQYIAAADNDPLTTTTYTAGQIKPVMDYYRRFLDISYFSLIGIYALQVIDAHVDAHLNRFDVSPNLSLYWSPTIMPTAKGIHHGMQIQLNF